MPWTASIGRGPPDASETGGATTKRPTVLLDLERLKHLHSGLGQFSLRLAEATVREEPREYQLVFHVPSGFAGRFGSGARYEVVSSRRRFAPLLCPRYDLWHATHQESRYGPADARSRYLLTIHDLHFLFEKAPDKARRRLRRLQEKVDRASALVFVSEFTRELASRHLRLPPIPLEVIHNGTDLPAPTVAGRPQWAPARRFVLFIGLVRERKNVHLLVEWIGRVPDTALVIAGNLDDPYAEQVRRKVRERGVARQVVLAGEVSDQEKAWLLQNCDALLLPSGLEGFGLPLVEAMAYGKPVFCSSLGSLPEVGGAEAFYWTDLEPDRMLEVFERGMAEVARDPGKGERLRIQARRFSWPEAAARYRALYLRLLGLSGDGAAKCANDE